MGLDQILRSLTGAFRWWVVVAPWEQAIRVRLGKRLTVLGPGFYGRIPGLDRIYRQSIRRRFSNIPTQTVTTADGKAVTISAALAYAIKDIGLLYDTLHNAEDVVQTEAAAIVARYVRGVDLAACDPREIEKLVTETLDLARYGLGDTEFAITDFAEVAPSALKKVATGKGNAGKELVLVEAVKRLGYGGSDNNESDALWLLEMARIHYGLPGAAELPKAHLEGLEKVSWPSLEDLEAA